MKHISFAIGLAVGVSFCLANASWAAQPLKLVSDVAPTNEAGGDASFGPVLSEDGRSLVFMSRANNLVTNDDQGRFADLFLRDLQTGQTKLISVDRSGQGGGNGDAAAAALSANGRCIVFASAAHNLVPNDTNSGTDVFVWEAANQTNRLVSVDFRGTNNALRPSTTRNVPLCANPLISGDGRWVAFESTATNLVAGYTNTLASVFVRDLHSDTTTVISTNLDPIVGNPECELEGLTPDGRYVLFTSRSVPPNALPSRKGEVFVRDLQERRTYWVSSNAPSFFTGIIPADLFYENMLSTSPVISADGRYVAFKTQAYGCAGFMELAWVFHHDLPAGSTLLVTSNALCNAPLQMSADGRFVAYGTAGSDLGTNVYVWDHQDQNHRLASVNRDGPGPGNGPSRLLALTPEGDKILFSSAATDLVTNTVNGLSQIYLRDLDAQTTRLVSANHQGQGTAEDLHYAPTALSPGGSLVAWESRASDWGSEDWNRTTDVYLWNADTEGTSLVSQRHPDRPDRTGVAPAALSSGPGALSANGRYVAIRSFDSFFDATDTNQWEDSFVRDLQTGQIAAVHHDASGGIPTNATSLQPALSADGRFAAFFSFARWGDTSQGPPGVLWRWDRQGALDLVASGVSAPAYPFLVPSSLSWDGQRIAFVAVSNGYNQVFVRDMVAQTNRLISAQPSGQPGTLHSQNPAFSPDDRWVVFESRAALLPGTASGTTEIYAYDLLLGRLRWVSQPAAPTHAKGAVWSADSRKLAYERPLEYAGRDAIVLNELAAATNRTVCTNCFSPSLSGDGRHMVYMQQLNWPAPQCNVILHDLAAEQLKSLASNIRTSDVRASAAPGLRISHDARFVIFASPVDDLVPDDHNGTWDVFVYDRLNDSTLLISRNSSGTASGNGASTHPVLASDGKTVAFQSFAEDLVEGDYNNRRDVFLLRLGGDDTDGDGLEDDWEMAYFNGLERDGTGDYDLDGHSDAQEFQAGTNPADDTSILRVLTISLAGSGQTTLLWSAVPGRTYRAQFKANLEDPTWTDLAGDVTTKATYGTKVDPSAGLSAKRFYRVMVVL